MAWEIIWTKEGSTGSKVWSRDPESRRKDARKWKFRSTGYLRERGVNTPKYRKDSWEIDWEKRNGKLVWARNSESKMPTARDWHWIDYHTVQKAGLQWRPASPHSGRYVTKQGYVLLTRRGMTDEEVALATKFELFRGRRKTFVREHQLVAVRKFGEMFKQGMVVRHLNGVQSDNSEANIVIGTMQENTRDHNTARLMAMFWRNKYESLLKQVERGESKVFLQQLFGRMSQ